MYRPALVLKHNVGNWRRKEYEMFGHWTAWIQMLSVDRSRNILNRLKFSHWQLNLTLTFCFYFKNQVCALYVCMSVYPRGLCLTDTLVSKSSYFLSADCNASAVLLPPCSLFLLPLPDVKKEKKNLGTFLLFHLGSLSDLFSLFILLHPSLPLNRSLSSSPSLTSLSSLI